LLIQPWWSQGAEQVLKLPAERAGELWMLCLFLMGYMFVGAAGTAVVAVFYALGDTRTPAGIGVVGFFVGLVAKSLAFIAGGITGLALATSLYYLVNLVALVHVAERRLDRLSAHPPLR
jgi:peptidoglycan biosynthesis protein MviN/MurJ (putative lipid II flippase)